MKSTMPRVPHLPGSRLGNDDLVVPAHELPQFLSAPVLVVEKLDGVALTIAADEFGHLDVGMKNDWKTALGGRLLRAARRWVLVHQEPLHRLLSAGETLYAEWLLHRLVVRYDRLPAAVICHGIRGRDGALYPRLEVNRRLRDHGFAFAPPVFEGVIGARPLAQLVPARSHFGRARAEGVIVEAHGGEGARWAKWVAPYYRQPRGEDLDGAENRVVVARSPEMT